MDLLRSTPNESLYFISISSESVSKTSYIVQIVRKLILYNVNRIVVSI